MSNKIEVLSAPDEDDNNKDERYGWSRHDDGESFRPWEDHNGGDENYHPEEEHGNFEPSGRLADDLYGEGFDSPDDEELDDYYQEKIDQGYSDFYRSQREAREAAAAAERAAIREEAAAAELGRAIAEQAEHSRTRRIGNRVFKVIRVPAEDPDAIRAQAAGEDALNVPITKATLKSQVSNVDEALTNPNATRATERQLDEEYDHAAKGDNESAEVDDSAGPNDVPGQDRA